MDKERHSQLLETESFQAYLAELLWAQANTPGAEPLFLPEVRSSYGLLVLNKLLGRDEDQHLENFLEKYPSNS